MTSLVETHGLPPVVPAAVTKTASATRVRRATVPSRVWIALVILAILILAAIVSVFWTPYDPTAQSLVDRLKPPSAAHLLGTDALGRDVLSRLMSGAQVSLTIAFVAGAGGAVIGVTLALISGYFGGRTDSAIMGWVEAQTSLPFLVLAITVSAILGPSLQNLIISLVITGWVFYARVVRAEAMKVTSQEYVTAARANGQGHLSIIFREVLPNCAGAIAVIGTQEIPRLILTASALSFLGLGVQPPAADWGNMIAEGRNYVFVAWWLTVAPGLVIVLFSVAASTVGDWLRDRFDPQSSAV